MAVSEYLSKVGNRDKIFGVLQFYPSLLSEIVRPNNKELAEGLAKLSRLADGYRTVTRFSGLFDVLTPANLKAIREVRNPVARNYGALELLCTVGFFPLEHLALLATYGVLDEKKAPKFAAGAVFFWFWGLVLRVGHLAFGLMQGGGRSSNSASDSSARAAQRKKTISFIRTFCYMLFAWSIMPAEVSILGPFGMLAPKAIPLPPTVKALLGSIAATTEFL